MNDFDRFYIKLQDFILAELSRRETEREETEEELRTIKRVKDNPSLLIAFVQAKTKEEYFHEWYNELLRFLKNCE